MWLFPATLAQENDFGEIAYVVAMLVLVVAGAVFDKLKSKMMKPGEPSKRPSSPPASRTRSVPRRPQMGQRPVPPTRAAPPTRPARPPAPPQREEPPVVWEIPEVKRPAPRPTVPVRPAPIRPGKPAVARKAEPSLKQHGETRKKEPRRLLEHQMVSRAPQLSQLSQEKPHDALAEPLGTHRTSVGSFRKLSRAEIRRAIVLNEILGPPVGLRGEGQTSWEAI